MISFLPICDGPHPRDAVSSFSTKADQFMCNVRVFNLFESKRILLEYFADDMIGYRLPVSSGPFP